MTSLSTPTAPSSPSLARPQLNAPESAIRVDGVAHVFRGQTGLVRALDRVDLEISEGSFVAILGPSGCGKTTLLRILSGLLEPSEGRVVLAGEPPAAARHRRAIGWLAQEDGLLPWRNVLDNVALPLRLRGDADTRLRFGRSVGRPGPSWRARLRAPLGLDSGSLFGLAMSVLLGRDRAVGSRWSTRDNGAAELDMLRRVGLPASARQYPHELSGGMRQRAALARALIARPPFLLLDEPFAHLDELTRERLGDLLLELRAESASPPTTVLVTHSVSEAVRLADRVVVLSSRPGRLLEDVEVGLPQPRHEDQKGFGSLVQHLKHALFNKISTA